MKLLTALVLVAGAALAWVGLRAGSPSAAAALPPAMPDAVPLAIADPVPAGCVVRTFAVEGICCDGCAGKLYGALAAIDGVREAAVDPTLARAQAVVPADFPVDELARALTFDDYTAEPTP